MVGGIEVHEQLVDLVDDLGHSGVGPVDLVDHQDHGQVVPERLAQHEPGLRQRALGGVDEQEDAVDHRERPLDLAPEVGVPGRVDDVERDTTPLDGGVLGENRDPLLALEVVGIHHPLGDLLVGAERAGLLQERVDERRLAVIDVGHDGEVAQVGAVHSEARGVGDMTRQRYRDGPLKRREAAPAAPAIAGARRR